MTTRRAAVLGHPIDHSLSPALHRAAYQALGLDWEYTAVDVVAGELAAFMAGLGPEWVGLSLTMPLKREVLPLVDELDETARLVGAANTVVLDVGRRLGANTDVPGFIAALQELHEPVQPGAVILGGGATAASALVALARLGAGEVQAFVRRPDAAQPLREVAQRAGVALTVSQWADAAQGVLAGLVVSTVPPGVTDQLIHAVPPLPGVLFDVVYAPWPTPLAARWALRGGTVLSGLDLLVHQARLQVQLMTGRDPGVEVLRSALQPD